MFELKSLKTVQKVHVKDFQVRLNWTSSMDHGQIFVGHKNLL